VRRFFCDSEDCGQQIFTERLPKTVQRYPRVGRRPQSWLHIRVLYIAISSTGWRA
jgi:hypothetical protein